MSWHAALADLDRNAKALTLPYFVLGAIARDVVLAGLGRNAARATLDIDVAICVSSWEEYEALVQLMLEDGSAQGGGPCFRRTSSPHRLVHASGYPIDLIPFGAIEGARSEIIWANDGAEMSVAGFRSALASAIEAQVAPQLTVRCVDLCSLVFLKCRAYLDRGDSTKKDIFDVIGLLEASSYALSDEDYFELMCAIEDQGLDDLPYGPIWVGHRMRARFVPELLEPIWSMLAEVDDPLSSVVDAATPTITADRERRLADVAALLTALRAGLA